MKDSLLKQNVVDLPSLFSLEFKPARLTKAIDWHGHLNFAAWCIELSRPKSIVELGVFRGDSLSTFSQASSELKLDCKIVGIDTWQGDNTTGIYGEEVYSELNDFISISYPGTILQRCLFEDAVSDFEDESIELLHIDGCHTYEAVRSDYETWLPKVSKKNGIILFHDIAVEQEGFGTRKFWREARSDFPSFDFVHSNGLGVLLVGQEQPDVFKLLAENNAALQRVRAIFELASSALVYRAKMNWWKEEASRAASYANVVENQLSARISDMISTHLQNHLSSTGQSKGIMYRFVSKFKRAF
ncbi:class I SAM-dependent methyltransferase [Vibrio cholerae]|nr:class I SAM-dependent methyltransferase [Vibrio cholerae]EIJ0935541.1 class I SAM-dependent methyltransferase [Vibrio cholerae]